jgi:putative transposase
MTSQRIYDDELYAHFVTFSCYKRRRLLDHDRAKKIVIGTLESQRRLASARCVGFVVMPNHVHAILWFSDPNCLSHFMKQWKHQSSIAIRRLLTEHLTTYASQFDDDDPI